MKTLILMRHAKAINGDGVMTDFERGLAERGKTDAAEMGKRLKLKNFTPDLILCSAAKRTHKTAKLVSVELGYNELSIERDLELYEASLNDMLHTLRQINDSHNQVLLVAHNPTISGMIGYLTGDFVSSLPTAGQACMLFDVMSWKQIMPQQGELVWVDVPKNGQD
jgi:phosphohistidine phosphatase